MATTKAPDPLTLLAPGITAQSVYAPEYRPELALDGSPDPFAAWIARPYGGGTREKPSDVWWQITFPGRQRLTLSGVKVVGDHRAGMPVQKRLMVQTRLQGDWTSAPQAIEAQGPDLVIRWPQPVETTGIRVLVPATDLPRSAEPSIDGIVRICELLFLLPDGREASPLQLLRP